MTRPMAPNRPQERRGWLRGLWLIWSCCACLCLFLSALALTFHQNIPDNRIFSGEILTTAHNTAVVLPPHLPVEAILVHPGQTVKSGQTLVALDRALIALHLEEKQRQILVQSALRQCFLKDSYHATMLSGAEDLDGETNLQLQSAAEDCRLAHSESALAHARINETLEYFQKQLKLHDTRIALALPKLENVELRQKTSLLFTLKREELKRKIGHLRQELARLSLQDDKRLLERAVAIEDQVRTARQHQKVLEHFAQSPRLQAPHSGTIVSTRLQGGTQPSLQAQEIVTLRAQHELAYQAQFSVPSAVAQTLAPGDRVHIAYSGGDLANAKHQATILKIYGATGTDFPSASQTADAVMVKLEISPELAAAIERNGLRSSRDRLLITVALPQQNLATALYRQLQAQARSLRIYAATPHVGREVQDVGAQNPIRLSGLEAQEN